PYQKDFVDLALTQNVLRFGSFTLKSGRQSPYFFNAGLFSTGQALAKLGGFCSGNCGRWRQLEGNFELDFTVVFGPAYKGIPLGAAVAHTLYESHGRDVEYTYTRKEKKDHGEGGLLVGADVKGKRVLIVDDVITAGTAIREAMDMLTAAGAVPAGVVIALDDGEGRGQRASRCTAGGEGGMYVLMYVWTCIYKGPREAGLPMQSKSLRQRSSLVCAVP
ncbi:orotate phosphoribosyltransferase, partial [Tribonema minus]